eukprot:TRINITY_DN7404_c0_g1_i2.p1 TRINITY_DN7404_c0_g1~~TRINITY_DN7404_c0_g1_i2.p1  ORF type:complete len:635 (-),score=73.28 TRINITY_DN7404_c0_g1_i2:242-2083(-)
MVHLPTIGGWDFTYAGFAFFLCLFVIFVDMMGEQFCGIVLAAYSNSLGLEKSQLGSLYSASAAGMIVSSFFLPWLSDLRGRRLAIMVSMGGSLCGFFLQGLAHVFEYPTTYGVLIAGRLISGLFAGTLGVILAFVTELSLPDVDLLKRRITMLMTVFQQGGTVLGPISGSLGKFGLHIPFFVATGSAAVGLPITFFFFRNTSEIRALEAGLKKKAEQDVENTDEKAPAKPHAPMKPHGLNNAFIFDPAMVAYFLCYTTMGPVMVCLPPLMTYMLSLKDYGFATADYLETQQTVGQVASLAMLPFSICNSIFMILVFPPLSKRTGNKKCGFISIILMVLGIGFVSLLAFNGEDRIDLGFESKTWMLCIGMGVFGVGFGLLFPLILASGPIYRGTVYPHRLGAAGAFCQRGSFVGMILGGPLVLGIYESTDNLGLAYVLIGADAVLLFFLFLVGDHLAMKRMNAFIMSKSKPTESTESDQLVAVKEGAVPENEFIEHLNARVVDVAKERNYCLWSAPEQALVEQEIIAALKALPLWAAGDAGLQHNVEVGIRLRNLGLVEAFKNLCDCSPSVHDAIATLQSVDENLWAITQKPATSEDSSAAHHSTASGDSVTAI